MNNIVLASASIGRKGLFQKYFNYFTISVSHIDETKIKFSDPYDLTKKLAYRKAMAISRFYRDDFVIGLDTVVVCEGKIIGKPKDKMDAKEILRFQSGKKQSVITGFCIINAKQEVLVNEYEETILHFKELNEYFIENYVSNNPVIKFAGAYAAQDQDEFINILDGDKENVIGAPMKKILSYLRNYSIADSVFKAGII